jgi:hypothetical protein
MKKRRGRGVGRLGLNSNSNKIFENAYRVENGVGNIRR